MNKLSRSQTQFLSQAIQLEETVNPALIRFTMMTISIAILAFVGWAAVTNINEVARTPGEIVPQGFQQVVQHLEGGIVRDIKVHEGDTVEKGQVLLRLDSGGGEEDLARALAKQAGLDMQEERLRAFGEQRLPDFSAYEKDNPNLVRDQKSFFEGMMQARTEEQKIIEEQILQKQRTLDTLKADLETARGNYAIAKDLYDRRQSLNKKGYSSDVQFLQAKQNLNTINGEIRQLQNRISVTQAEISEFRNRLTSLDATTLDNAHERLDQVMAERAQNTEIIAKLKDRTDRLSVRAPVSGVVKGLAVNTVGAVAQPGQTLMEIVPLDAQLVVQARISPQYIGHLKTGQPVQVKLSSFDFSRYGFVTGTLEQISPTTFTGDKGERYYQGLIRLDRNYVGDNPHNTIVPGMTVMADIVTGRKTILEYLLKPIHVAVKTAFSER
jgi:membrane fusion protein, adhesin transport system